MNDNCKLFVANLPFAATEDDLAVMFSDYGEVVGTKVIRDGERSRGYGFVTFSNATEAKAALELDGAQYGSRVLAVRLAEQRKYGKDKR
jgi:RNA recognition motif-containing protein